MQSDFRLFPESASTISGQVDALYLFLVSVASFFTILICVLIVYFAIRYRRNVKVDRSNPPSSYLLEIGWSIVPLVLALFMFYWGALIYFRMYQPPPEADEIYVVGKQWMWKIQHPNGRREINELHVAVNRPVTLKMISEDVIHDFFVPAFRVKQDVLPGRYTHMWFEPTKVGTYHLFCAEYCGTSHSQMIGKIIVMEPADYAAWLSGEMEGQPAEVSGQQLFEQFRCDTCHRKDGRCPPLDGIFGKTVRLADGSSVIADEEYLRESILMPNEKVVAGYKPVMPTYKGQIGEEGVLQIIAYLKTLAGPATEGEPGASDTSATTAADDAAPAAEAPAAETPAAETPAPETPAAEAPAPETPTADAPAAPAPPAPDAPASDASATEEPPAAETPAAPEPAATPEPSDNPPSDGGTPASPDSAAAPSSDNDR